jgi:LysM repeat protein
MSLWTLVKIFAALCVMAVMALTAMFAYHVTVAPLGGVFSKLIPDPVGIAGGHSDTDLVKMLEASEMPDVDPGEKAYQKAHELLAMGRIPEAREKLTAIVNVFPNSSSAPIARRITGEINLDEILSSSRMEGKQIHAVKRGDSLLGIAAKYNTTIDCIMHLNSLMEIPRIQPGDELLVMPLGFRILIEPRRKSLSLWDGGRFIREYPVLHFDASARTARRTAISSKPAELEGRRVPPQSEEYRAADKVILIEKPALQIRGWDDGDDKPAGGILLRPQDMEELALLTRVGNEVEIR